VVVRAAEPVVLADGPGAVSVSEPQVSVDIAVVFVVSIAVSVVVVEVDSSGHPKFVAFPNVDCSARSSSSVEVAG
jgi:hypothetical protein